MAFWPALGMISGLAVIFHLARIKGLDPDQMWNLGGLAAFSGILGAKLLMLMVDWREYMASQAAFSALRLCSPAEFSRRAGAGDSLQLVVRAQGEDSVSLRSRRICAGVALGHAFGRIGCLAAGCCYGAKRMCRGRLRFTIRGQRTSPARR